MTEAGEPGPEMPVGAAAGASAGALLRAAREAAGMHIGALAVSLKVPVAKLEALEADRIEALPDAVFARALAASVCKALKIDPAPVLQRLPGAAPAMLVPDRLRSHGAFREAGERWQLPLAVRVSRPVAIVVGLLALGTLLLLLWPQRAPVPAGEGVPAPAGVPDAAASGTPAAVAATPATAAPVPASVPAPAPVPAPAAAQAPASAMVQAPTPVPAAPQSAASTAAVPAGGAIEFRARAGSWIEVTDASGSQPLRRTLSAGESVVVGGTPPLSVVVGRADVTEVLVRGRVFDLTPVTRDNVARFQVR